ncbi:DUF559 domain-containing protein [Collinsella sp. zg1085]|uniref:DUF559 domain-containing protein n=1 Tax=Collinsella sp. zg1085 TaxID=2844380 RepID=UPI001C0C02EB|nr:DUF559 domain-containing protein [Collinsella sp. zg1085]QWT17949.1 DUF559 domain-containing protein [Collinsella sp. zg1085]
MRLCISHQTARAWYRLKDYPAASLLVPNQAQALQDFKVVHDDVAQAQRVLAAYGLPQQDYMPLHILVPSTQARLRTPHLSCHVCSQALPAQSLQVFEHLMVPTAPLLAVQSSQDFSFLELVEYFYELCGAYHLPLQLEEPFCERIQLTSVENLTAFAQSCVHKMGRTKTLSALRFTRNGARSPMETVCAMLVGLSRKHGGLGVIDFDLNARIEVPNRLRHLTRSHAFYADILLRQAKLILEYQGFNHEESQRAVSDEERRNTLAALGYRVIAIWKHALFQPQDFQRLMLTIERAAGLRKDRHTDEFVEKQAALRRFLLRRMLDKSSR